MTTPAEPDGRRTVLYLVNSWPSVSETFVKTEIESIVASGSAVAIFALQPPSSVADIPTIPAIPGSGRRPSTLSIMKSARECLSQTIRHRSTLMDAKEFTRLWYATERATTAIASLNRAGIRPYHIHAHFLGRASDVARILAEKLSIQWSATAHAGDAYNNSEPGLQRLRLSSVDHIHCASTSVEKAIQGKAQGISTSVVRCGIAHEKLPQSSAKEIATYLPRLLTIGRLVENKGIFTCLKAARRLQDANIPFIWDIIGDGPLKAPLAAEIHTLGLESQVNLLGPLSHSTSLDRIARCDAFILPSQSTDSGRGDGIPVALMEAMALLKPVITTHAGGISELVTEEVGSIVPERNPVALAAAVQAVLSMDPTDRSIILERAQDTVRSRFNVRIEAEKMRVYFASR